ncbi:hypothetical protein CTU88_02870 [Streptomyces sp. JV178]|nr:hypothetical protein CTU88_02870 [Streptomyces sp. JV178]
MPSVTVVVSSDTDIYISPGLYGDCLPTSATAGVPDSFRPGRSGFPPRPSSCSHMARVVGTGRRTGVRSGRRDSCHIDAMGIVNVT